MTYLTLLTLAVRRNTWGTCLLLTGSCWSLHSPTDLGTKRHWFVPCNEINICRTSLCFEMTLPAKQSCRKIWHLVVHWMMERIQIVPVVAVRDLLDVIFHSTRASATVGPQQMEFHSNLFGLTLSCGGQTGSQNIFNNKEINDFTLSIFLQRDAPATIMFPKQKIPPRSTSMVTTRSFLFSPPATNPHLSAPVRLNPSLPPHTWPGLTCDPWG